MAEVKKEYVHGLMESHRIKRGESDYPEIGEIVLIIGDEKNRGEWKKGRVLFTLEAETES